MKASFNLSRLAGLAAAVLALAPAAGSAAALQIAANQHLEVDNRSPEPVTVRVLHSDGSLDKQHTVASGDTYRFTFEWCASCCGHDKHRSFEVKTGSTLRAKGDLNMHTKAIQSGPETITCDENNQMTVKDADAGDAWTFAESYENGHRTAVLTVTRPSSY